MTPASGLAESLRDAARIVARVAAGRSLADELPRGTEAQGSRAALIDLTHGTLRRYGRVPALVRILSTRAHPDRQVEALLWCSLYALESGRHADYTVVDQAVRACALLEKWPAKGYVNALLREYLRRRQALEAQIERDAEARHQHPQWWIDMLRATYPEDWEAILAAGNSHPPMCLRVNARRLPAEQYLEKLASAGIGARWLGGQALLLERPMPVDRLPGFKDGEVSVQDAGAQRAARCLDLAAGQRVLDACAAPGGKSAHILESAEVQLTSLDVDARRCERIGPGLARLGLAASVRSADCTQIEAWWDGVPFDRVLADVPCTASGIARRRPDLKWTRRATDAHAFAERQARILAALWRVLGPGGKLLYATCSVFAQENDAVIEAFISQVPEALRAPLPDAERAQWLPNAEHDGFYYALLQKRA